MKKSKFKIVEDLMLFLSQKQHIFGLCFIISLIFITFAYENSNLNAEDVGVENNNQLIRTFYEEITEDNITTHKDRKLLSCGINVENVFGISDKDMTLNTNLNYLFSDFKNNIKYSIDLYGIDDSKELEEKALFKVYTSKKYNPDRKADVCTYDDNGNVLTGNENQSDDKDYILCDISRMQGSNNCTAFSGNNDGSLKCADYNVDNDTNKKYCYSKEHICNTYKDIKEDTVVAIDKEFIDQYLGDRNVKKDNLGNYFYLFYKYARPTDQEVKRIQDTVNCFQTFYNCDLTPYWNVKNVEEKLKDTGNSSITVADEFVNVIIDGKGDNYYNNEAFKEIINGNGVPLFVENTTERCCLKTNDESCDYKLCFAEENKDHYIEYFENSKIYKYIKGNTVMFFTRSVSRQTCKNYLPECTSIPTITPLYKKIDGKVDIKNDEEQNSLYKASETSNATCLYAEGTKKNNIITYSTETENNSKSYCSDLLMDENGKLKLKYENGLEKENGAQKDNCFLKSCIDLNQDELTAIAEKSNTNNVYCSPYRYLRDYNKIGVSLDLKFLPISDGKIMENYYCDSYNEGEKEFVFKNGIDHEKKENCYLRRCISLSKEVLKVASEKRTASLFDAIFENVDEYVSSHSNSDFSSVSDSDIKTINRNKLKQYCENRAFFTKNDFVEDNLNLLSCSEFKGKTVKSANYEDIAFTKRDKLRNFLCVDFKTVMRNDITSIGNDSNDSNNDNIEADEISFITDVFATFGGNTNKVNDSSMLSNFEFSANFLRYSEIGKRNICKGVDNTMIYISGDMENLNDDLDFNSISDITVDKYFLNRCEIEKEENSKRLGQINKCRFGNDDILNTDGSNTTKINNIKNNLLKKYFEKNIVDCADYGSEKETDNNIQRVVDCKLMDFLSQKEKALRQKNNENGEYYEESYYIRDAYNECKAKYVSYDNLNEQELFTNIQTFYANEGKLYLPVPLKKVQSEDGESEKSPYSDVLGTGRDETSDAAVCGYEDAVGYNEFSKYAPTVGCYPLADDFAYIDMATNYEELKDNRIVNISGAKPKDFTFSYIPVFTRYINTKGSDEVRRQCGERRGSSFNDKLAILTSGNIDMSGEFKYVKNDKYLTAAGHSDSSNFYKYGGGKYGNNICIFVYKDLSNCVTGTFSNFRDIVNWDTLRTVYRDTHKANCLSYMTAFNPGCSGIGDSYKPTKDSMIKYVNYDTYQKILKSNDYETGKGESYCSTSNSGLSAGGYCPSTEKYIFVQGINTIKFGDFDKLFLNSVFTYGGSVKDYYPYNNDYDHGVLAKFNILSSYRGDVIRNTSTQSLSFNTNFYENLSNRYQFSDDKYYRGLTTKKIIENCNLTDVFKDGQFNKNILNSDSKLEAARKCLKQYNADFFAKNPNENIKDFGTVVYDIGDVIVAPLKNKNGIFLGGRGNGKAHPAQTAAIKIRLDNNGGNYQPFKTVNYIGNQEEYNEKNINCYFDEYGFPISNLKYCRGIFTTKGNVTNFDIYNDSDMKDFLLESQCLRLPLASAPQPYFDLATPYNTPSLFSPIFILTKYTKWDTTSVEVDFKTNGVSGVVTSFFHPELYFNYYFTADNNNYLFRNTENNGTNNLSKVETGKTLQEQLSTLKFASIGTGSRVFKKSFAGKKSFILSDKGFYYPIMCVSTYIDTERKSLDPSAEQCDPKYKGVDDSCVISDAENFVCVDRMVPTYKNIYMRLDKNFSFRKPYINAFIYDPEIDKNGKIKGILNKYYKTDGSVKVDNSTSTDNGDDNANDDSNTNGNANTNNDVDSNDQENSSYKNFVLEGDVEEDSKAIDSKGFNQVQQFGLKFERSLCSQLDIEYFDYLEKLSMLAEDNEAQRAIYTTELEKINEVIKPNCMEAQGDVIYLDKIDITKGNCEETASSAATAGIPTDNVLLPINESNLYLQCKNEAKIGKILDRIKIVRNPIADRGHKEICISDSNFEDMMQANKDQKTFDYSENENQVVVFNSSNGTNLEDSKCLLDSNSRKDKNCRIADFVYVEDNVLGKTINKDTKGSSIFVSESDGSVYKLKKIDCNEVDNISDKDLANIYSFDDITLEKIKYCYKGGYNYSGNVSKVNGENDYSCRCMKKSVAATNNILKNGIFSSRAINKRELGLCVDIDNAVPTCEAVSYKNPAAESSTSYEEQVRNMKFSKITALMSDLFKDHSGYEDERWEHIWRNRQKMFNSIGSYSDNSKSLGHAEFVRYPYCGDANEKNCFGKSKVSVGTCSGFYRNGTRKVLAECKKVGDKYEFERTDDSGECIPDSCAGVGYTEVFNDLNTNEESLLNNNKNNKNFTQAELVSYSNVQNSLNAFNTTDHKGEISRETIDNRGLFNGFAAWKETQSDVVSVRQNAVACLTGYGPAGTNYVVHKFFPYIKNIEDSIDFRTDFSVDTDKRIANMNNLLSKQYDIFNELVNVSRKKGLKEGSLMKYIADSSPTDFIYLYDNLPVRFCNQLGNWEESRDIYNNVLKDGNKNIDPVELRYYSKNDYYTDLKKGKKYLNNTVLSQGNGMAVPVFERANVLFNDGVSDYNDSINTKYCERLFCQALSMDEVSNIYNDYNIYNYEYDVGNYISGNGSSNDMYYITSDINQINKHTPWRHLGGANWEATSAPRNHSNELIKGSDAYDPSNRIIDNVIGINGTNRDPTKIMYLKKVNGVCDNKYGYYNRGTKFVLNSFSKQFETLKQKVPDNQTIISVREINAAKIGGAKTTGYETPFRTCSSIGLWSGVYNSCYRACEMIDMYHTNFSNDRKYDTFRTGKNGDVNSSFKKEHYISNGDVVSFNLYPSFDRFRINSEKVVFKIPNEEGQKTDQEYKLGDYITGGASWPTTIVGLKRESETKFDNEKNLRYVEVEGTCDTTNPYNRTFVSNVDPNNYATLLRPKRRCYEDGTWGPIENLCVLFNTCNELSLNIFDLSNLLLQKGDINKMNKVINKKLLAQADCFKLGSDKDCYKNMYNATYINKGLEVYGLPIEDKTIQTSIKKEHKNKLFSDKSEAEIDGIVSGEFFTVNAGVHVNPTETKRSVYVPLNLKENDNNFAFTYADSNFSGCETNDAKESCFIDETKSAGYKAVDFYKMQCNFDTDDSMPWKFTSSYLGNYVYPMICDKDSNLETGNKALNRTRLFNNRNLKNNIDDLLMYVKESNFHVLSYLINEGDKSKMFKELKNCKQVSSDKDGCDEYGTRSYENQNDFSGFNVSLPISATENRELSSYQHITYCDERYFYNEDPANRGSDTEYLYRPIVIECTKPTDSDSKKGKFTMLNIRVNSVDQSSFSAEQCYPRYCGRNFFKATNKELSDVSGSKFTGNTIQNNWTLSHNNEYGEKKGYYGEIDDDHKITDYMSNIVQCDKYTSKSRLNAEANDIEIDKVYVLNFEKSKNVDKGIYKMNNTIFTFYSAGKDGITDAAWIGKNYVKDISTVCETNEADIESGVFNGISLSNETVKNAILRHKLASLDLSVFKNGQVKFCENLNNKNPDEKSDSNTVLNSDKTLSEESNKCQTVSEAVLASGEIDTTKQGTTATNTFTSFADKYCVPLACDGEVDLKNLVGFTDTNKNAKKIYLDYDKYQIGDYAIIENVAGDFTSVGNTTAPINGSNIYIMSTYLSDSGGVKTKNGNWYINRYQNGGTEETILDTSTVDDAFGLVCQKDYDQYFAAGAVAEPTKESISEKTFSQCKLYIDEISMTEYNRCTEEIKKQCAEENNEKCTEEIKKQCAEENNEKCAEEIKKQCAIKNKHVKYTETLQNLINFVNKTGTFTDEAAKSKIDKLLEVYIRKRIESIREGADGNFGEYVDYGNFANDSNIETIKETTIKKVGDSNKYYIFTGTSTSTTAPATITYIVSADGNTKFSSENMTCGSSNKTYLFETSLCDYNGEKYIEIKDHKSFKPSSTTITINDEGNNNVEVTYQPDEAMYILQDKFITEYKTAFENVYATYIEKLLKNSTSVAKFYDNHANIQLINPDRFNGNEFGKYNAYEDLKEQLTNRYKSIEYLSDGLFTNDNIKDEIYKKITGNSDVISVSLEKDNKIISLNIRAQIVNKNLSLYTLKNAKVDKHTRFLISLKNYKDAGTIDKLDNGIEDWTNNIVIRLEEDLMSDIDSLNNFENTSTLKSEFGFTDKEVVEIKDATCANTSGLENCTDDNIAKRKIAKDIWSAKNTNNSIIEGFNSGCQDKNASGCDEANKDKAVTIDMDRLDSSSIEKFKPYIEKLVETNQILEGLYLKNYRERLINKDYIENNCVVFSDEKINACYQEKGGLCELLKAKPTSHFERMYIEEYQKFKGNASNAPFKQGLFMALQCGVDGKWKLVGGNNAVQCKKRCSDSVVSDTDILTATTKHIRLFPEGYSAYDIDMYIDNLRYGSSGKAQLAAVGVYCSRGNKDQSQYAEVTFTCSDYGFLMTSRKYFYPNYKYNYNFPNPGVRSTCMSWLENFNGEDGSFSYYRNAATGSTKRNNRGVIVTCPNTSTKRIIHHVGKGHMCGLDKNDKSDGAGNEYPAYHGSWPTFECKADLSKDGTTDVCDGKFNKTAQITYNIKELY